MATMLSNRRSTFAITCVQCHEELIAPDKSEYRSGTHIRHLWHCSNCSARFESIEQIPVEAMTADDIFPSLLVA
jgi:hydrogenase maturation factor HypF (carbamoyltransferase family)